MDGRLKKGLPRLGLLLGLVAGVVIALHSLPDTWDVDRDVSERRRKDQEDLERQRAASWADELRRLSDSIESREGPVSDVSVLIARAQEIKEIVDRNPDFQREFVMKEANQARSSYWEWALLFRIRNILPLLVIPLGLSAIGFLLGGVAAWVVAGFESPS